LRECWLLFIFFMGLDCFSLGFRSRHPAEGWPDTVASSGSYATTMGLVASSRQQPHYPPFGGCQCPPFNSPKLACWDSNAPRHAGSGRYLQSSNPSKTRQRPRSCWQPQTPRTGARGGKRRQAPAAGALGCLTAPEYKLEAGVQACTSGIDTVLIGDCYGQATVRAAGERRPWPSGQGQWTKLVTCDPARY